jgi:hypothetical protein
MIVVGVALMLIAAVGAVFLLVPRSSAPRQVVVPVDPNDGWEAASAKATSNLGTMDQMTRDRETYVQRYPRSPGTPMVLNQLGGMYIMQDRFADSIRAYEAAKALVAAGVGVGAKGTFTPSLGILEVNIADAHRRAGDLAQAETILALLIARPLPAKVTVDAYVPQVFVGPLTLADVRQDQHRGDDADALRRNTADRALQLAKANPAETEWISSYAASAYMKRINTLLEDKPPKFDAARALAEEFNRRLPGYSGIMGYNDMLAGVAMVQSRQTTATSAPAASPVAEPPSQPARPAP